MNSFNFNFNFECHQQVLSTSKIVEPFLDFFPDTKKKAFKIERFVCYKAPNQNTKYKKYQFCIFDFVTIRSSLRKPFDFDKFRSKFKKFAHACSTSNISKNISNQKIKPVNESKLVEIVCSSSQWLLKL